MLCPLCPFGMPAQCTCSKPAMNPQRTIASTSTNFHLVLKFRNLHHHNTDEELQQQQQQQRCRNPAKANISSRFYSSQSSLPFKISNLNPNPNPPIPKSLQNAALQLQPKGKKLCGANHVICSMTISV